MVELANGSTIQSGTVNGLMEYLDFVVAKGYGPASTVTPQKSAVRQMFQIVQGTDEFGDLDMRALDLPEYLDRFETKALGHLKAESIQTYRSRASRAIRAYQEFLQTGRPPAYRQTTKRTRAEALPRTTTGDGGAGTVDSTATTGVQTGGRLIDYPFPLRSGQIANLRLPARLEKADAERMAAFIRTLVLEPQLQLTEGGSETLE